VWIPVGKIGVLVFTEKAKERTFKKANDAYDGKKNYGIKKVLSQLNEKYEYCSPSTINNYDHVLCSLTSWFDILNLIRNVPIQRKAKIHIGGPGVNNIRGYLDYFDTAWFGRCDKGEVNKIIDGLCHESLYRKSLDPEFVGEYKVCVGEPDTIGHDGENETSVGCSQKCTFCHYSFWNKYVEKDEKSYKSGQKNYEDFFQSVDWSRGKIITALDGMTENTRKIVRKPISYDKIKEKLLESNQITGREKNLAVKIYSIIGYPWESKDEISKCDITKALKEISPQLKNKILMYFHFSHFVPMQKTPMWWVNFNWSNYWEKAKESPLLFGDEKIKLYTGTSTTSPASAACETIIQRAQNQDGDVLRMLASKKWNLLASTEKVLILQKNFNRFFVEQEKEAIPNIITPYKYSGWDYKKLWRFENGSA
jgi:radical SAM superfamily enzyme YgiQ (UPF0313 family)